MKKIAVICSALVLTASVALAGAPKSYQATGPVLELKDDLIVVQKGSEKWEIARDKDTKVTGDLKVGSKVTIQYQMKAAIIAAIRHSNERGPESFPVPVPVGLFL
jgi:hypothetical protein